MTTQTLNLTAEQIQNANKATLLVWAKTLEIVGRHDMTKADLKDAVIQAAQATEDNQSVSWAADMLEVLEATESTQESTEVLESPWESEAPEAPQVEPEPSECPIKERLEKALSMPLLAPAAEAPEAPQKAKKPVVTELSLPEEIIQEVQSLYKTTAASCTDPGRLVVNRLQLFEILGSHWNKAINAKIANQLVVIASRKFPRQPLTINSTGSRFKYLLAETNEGQNFPVALLVLNYLWDRPECFKAAQANYRVMSQTGSEFVK